MPFHRKFRPKTLAEYIGNDKVKKRSMAAVRSDTRPQVLLYEGTAGCGKTTMARLMAKEYMCENRDEFSGACGECYNCTEMERFIETGDAGNLTNVREVDVTDSNKRQDIDQLLEDASEPSYDGNWKIFILDECHMMTVSAQNRLLKNLEEPAEKVLMVLCTTDPEKLLETIISRCQYRFRVTKPTRDELGNLLARVCKHEGVDFEPRALSLLCVKGDFVPRKTLVALEAVVREKEEVTYANTLEVMDMISDRFFFDFYGHLLQEPISVYQYVTFIGELKSQTDFKVFVDSLVEFTKRGIYINNGVDVEALDKSELAKYRKIFGAFSVFDIAHLLQLLIDMQRSKDIETRLLMLGYTGLLRPATETKKESIQLIDDKMSTPAQEKRSGDEFYLESITLTEEESQQFIEKQKAPVTALELAEMFGGEIIEPD